MAKPKGLYILNPDDLRLIYSPQVQSEISQLVDIYAPPMTSAFAIENYRVLEQAEFIFSGWGGPTLDLEFLQNAGSLEVMFYGAGSLAAIVTPATWARGIRITTSAHANSIPVAEYALATILFSLKSGWSLARQTRELKTFVDRNNCAGCYGSTVGLISMGATARILRKFLTAFDLRVLVYDPFLSPDEAKKLDVELVTLESLFEQSDVVSLHAPLLAETIGLVTGQHLNAMKPKATFINTSRGTIVRQSELIQVAKQRTDLHFVLDVAEPEPPHPSSPLYSLPNVVLTPHMAGSTGRECERLGQYMLQELQQLVSGKPLLWEVFEETVFNTSHQPFVRQQSRENKPQVTTYLRKKSARRSFAVDQTNS